MFDQFEFIKHFAPNTVSSSSNVDDLGAIILNRLSNECSESIDTVNAVIVDFEIIEHVKVANECCGNRSGLQACQIAISGLAWPIHPFQGQWQKTEVSRQDLVR